MTYHDLKLNDAYFEAVAKGLKKFEVRRDDRGFQKGDILRLNRFDPKERCYLTKNSPDNYTQFFSKAKHVLAEIKYVLTGGQLGIEPGYVVLSIEVQSNEL